MTNFRFRCFWMERMLRLDDFGILKGDEKWVKRWGANSCVFLYEYIVYSLFFVIIYICDLYVYLIIMNMFKKEVRE